MVCGARQDDLTTARLSLSLPAKERSLSVFPVTDLAQIWWVPPLLLSSSLPQCHGVSAIGTSRHHAGSTTTVTILTNDSLLDRCLGDQGSFLKALCIRGLITLSPSGTPPGLRLLICKWGG